MTDAALTAMWLAVLCAGVGGAVLLRGVGLASTYVRDLLHVGAGVWVVGWPHWDGAAAPIAIVAAVAAAVALVPALATHLGVVERFRDSVAGGDERYAGLIVYTVSYATFTVAGLLGDPFPAGAALLSLSLGDGIGGAVGRRFGRRRFRTPLGKGKSVEGTVAVALAAAAGVAAAAALFGVALAPWHIGALGAIAAAAEALAPRSSDNAIVPAVVWLAAEVIV